MGDILFQMLFDGLCYYTGKFILPVISLGWLKVEDRPGSWWNPFARLPNGRIAVSHDAAAIFGLIVWMAVIIGGLSVWRLR